MLKNAQLHRNALRGLVAALALGGFQVAHAGYAQLANPVGYASTSGGHTYAAAANDRIYGRVVHQAGALTANVGGQAVKMPAAYRFAANAPRIAARVVFFNPYVAVGVGVAAWLVQSNLKWDDESKTWTSTNQDEKPSDGFEYTSTDSNILKGAWYPTYNDTCYGFWKWFGQVNPKGTSAIENCFPDKVVIFYQPPSYVDNSGKTIVPSPSRYTYGIRKRASTCPAGWYQSDAGCLQFPQPKTVTEEDFVERVAANPMPSTVPQELPYPTPLPVDQPFVNPAPGENPANRPQRVPTGQPVPIPNTDPQQWRQPYVDIIPAPTTDSPWRVDIKPGETTSTNPNPAENPQPDDQDKPTPEEDKSLCEKHPDILACQKPDLDVPDGEIPKLTKQITYAEEGGFGGGSCPSNVYANLHGKQTMVYEWTRTCSVVSTYIRPIILLLGAMGALFILIPGRDS